MAKQGLYKYTGRWSPPFRVVDLHQDVGRHDDGIGDDEAQTNTSIEIEAIKRDCNQCTYQDDKESKSTNCQRW
jgi:hypothetical protein